ADGSDRSAEDLIAADDGLQLGVHAAEIVQALGGSDQGDSAPVTLGELLARWPAIERLRAALHTEPGGPRRLSEVSREVWPEAGDASLAATAALLRWSSAARQPAGTPLLVHRLHLPVRGAAGLGL